MRRVRAAWNVYKELSAAKELLVGIVAAIVAVLAFFGTRVTQDDVLKWLFVILASVGAFVSVIWTLAAFWHRVVGTSPIVQYVERSFHSVGDAGFGRESVSLGMPAPLVALEGIKRLRESGRDLLEKGASAALRDIDVMPWIGTLRQWEEQAAGAVRTLSLSEAAYFAGVGAIYQLDRAVFPDVVERGQGGQLMRLNEELRRLDEIIGRLGG